MEGRTGVAWIDGLIGAAERALRTLSSGGTLPIAAVILLALAIVKMMGSRARRLLRVLV